MPSADRNHYTPRNVPEYMGLVGPLIKRHRTKLGIDRSEFATTLGYLVQPGRAADGFRSVEEGKSEPSIAQLFRIAELLGIDFVNDLADEFLKAVRKGLAEKRDEEIAIANRHLEEAQKRAREMQTVEREPLVP